MLEKGQFRIIDRLQHLHHHQAVVMTVVTLIGQVQAEDLVIHQLEVHLIHVEIYIKIFEYIYSNYYHKISKEKHLTDGFGCLNIFKKINQFF